MRIRHRNWLVLMLAPVVLISIVQPTVAADTDDSVLTVEEECALFPADEGFQVVPIPGNHACELQRGDCLSVESTGDCIRARITALDSPEQARGYDEESPLWGAVVGLGEAAFERDFEAGRPTYHLQFRRDRYLFWVFCDPVLTQEARALAAHIDRELASALAQGSSDTGDSTGDDSGSSPDGVKLDIGGVFFGEGTVTYEDLAQFMDCPRANPDNPLYDPRTSTGFVGARCGGAITALERSILISESAREVFPEPTPQQQALIDTWIAANVYAVLEAEDGQPLFPSVLGAIGVLDKLITEGLTYTPPGGQTVPAAKRFLEMLIALDANTWAQRFDQGGSP